MEYLFVYYYYYLTHISLIGVCLYMVCWFKDDSDICPALPSLLPPPHFAPSPKNTFLAPSPPSDRRRIISLETPGFVFFVFKRVTEGSSPTEVVVSNMDHV